jgi:hypothetical protein
MCPQKASREHYKCFVYTPLYSLHTSEQREKQNGIVDAYKIAQAV